MKNRIIAYEEEKTIQKKLLSYLLNCDWEAAHLLAKFHSKNEFFKEDDKTYFLMDGENVISFLTLAHQDCVADESMRPWIGFVYTDKDYRGKRNSEKLIKYALRKAKDRGFSEVFLASNHNGLYEKYGFKYLEKKIDVFNEEVKVYIYNLK